MNVYPYTLTPPSSNEDSPQTINMHSPNHHYMFQPVANMPTQFIIPVGNQYDVSMTNLYTTGKFFFYHLFMCMP